MGIRTNGGAVEGDLSDAGQATAIPRAAFGPLTTLSWWLRRFRYSPSFPCCRSCGDCHMGIFLVAFRGIALGMYAVRDSLPCFFADNCSMTTRPNHQPAPDAAISSRLHPKHHCRGPVRLIVRPQCYTR